MPPESRAAARSSQRPGLRRPPGATSDDRPVVARRRQPTLVPVVRPVPPPPPAPALPVRLRYLVALVALGLTVRSVGLRAAAYWQLHGAATELANYAACMVGPTGPTLIRAQPGEFWRLVRRRIVAALPDARPFAPCLPALMAFAGGERRAAHAARAADFREFGMIAAAAPPMRSILDLSVTSARLDELAHAAWPFAPAQVDALVTPERTAKAAPHPMALPVPARGRGLPAAELGYSSLRATGASVILQAGEGGNARAYRSEDGGLTWVADEREGSALRHGPGPCTSGAGKSRFQLTQSGAQLQVDSWVDGAPGASFPLAAAGATLLGFACDETAAIAIVRADAEARPTFELCPHLAPCRPLSVPRELRGAAAAVFSITRARGVTVISMAHTGIVRVISSRDDGETWIPSVVAFDREEPLGGAGARGELPVHLLSLGSRIMLYAGATERQRTYPVLFSDDFGASWRAE